MMKTIEINKVWRLVTCFLLLYFFTFLPFTAVAQKLVPEKAAIDVGRTGYRVPITAVFELRNKGGRKMRIEKVTPDCYCTVVDYPKGELGEHFQIRMTYDAKLLGHFDKQVAVYTSGAKKPLYLSMKGVVLEHYVDVSGHYPVDMGDLRLDSRDLEFDDINQGDMREQQLHIYNNSSTETYQPNLLHLPPYLTALVQPEQLKPGEEGVITVTLNSSKLHGYGLTQTSIFLAGELGEKVSNDREIGVSAVLLPSFYGMTDMQQAAKIALSTETVNINFESKAKKTEIIDIQNVGHSELHISSLQMFTPGLHISLDKSRIKPGDYAKLKITAIAADLQKVRTRPRILMITNDPQKPKVIIELKH